MKLSAEWNQKNVKNYNIYAEWSQAEIFFEHFITKDLNIAPKKYITDLKKEDKEDILPKKEEILKKEEKGGTWHPANMINLSKQP